MAADSKVKSLEGREISDYVRDALPMGRWGDTLTVFKSNFSKILINNLLTLVFFIPLVVIIYMRTLYIAAVAGYMPFSANIGIGYQAFPNVSGLEEQLYMSADKMFYSLAIAAALIAAVGFAGSCYSMKKLLATHGEFTVKGYFRGVKKCYFKVAFPTALFMIVLFFTVWVCDWKELTIAQGGSSGWPTAAMVLMIILCVLVGIICMWLIAVGVSYKVGPIKLVKNSFIFIFGSILQTVIMLGIAFIPVWFLLMGSLMRIIAFVIFIVFGFSFVSLVWMSFTQWVFDMYINPNIEAQEKAKHENMSEKQLAELKAEEGRAAMREMLAAGRSEIIGKPIPPIQGAPVAKVGKVFGRDSIAAVAASRAALEKSIADYEQEHINDEHFVEYNKLFADREKALKDDGKKGKKKKKISADNLLK